MMKTSLQGLGLKLFAFVMFLTLGQASERLIRFQDLNIKLFGFKDASEKIILPAQYEYASDFSKEGLSIVRFNYYSKEEVLQKLSFDQWPKWFRINKKGEVVEIAHYNEDGPDPYVEGLTRFISEKGKFGFSTPEGRHVIPAQFDYAKPFINGLAFVCKAESVKTNQRLDPLKKRWVKNTQFIDVKWGAIDKKGQLIFPIKYDDVVVWKDKKHGFKKKKKCFQIQEGCLHKRTCP